jgi:prolyl 4-hydroxylase
VEDRHSLITTETVVAIGAASSVVNDLSLEVKSQSNGQIDAIVSQTATIQSTAAASIGSFVYEPTRVTGSNIIRTSDRDIRVVARFNQPDLVVLANVLSLDECDELVQLSTPKIERSTTIDSVTGRPIIIENRTSHGTFFYLNQTEFIARLDKRISELMAWPLENGEGIQILNYGIGGEYRPHFDYFPPEQTGSKQPLTQGGQRVATLIMYLNDVEEGGATVFPDINFAVSPRKGQAVYFSYFNSQGQVDPTTLHGGAPVLKGEKWIATKWMRQWKRS